MITWAPWSLGAAPWSLGACVKLLDTLVILGAPWSLGAAPWSLGACVKLLDTLVILGTLAIGCLCKIVGHSGHCLLVQNLNDTGGGRLQSLCARQAPPARILQLSMRPGAAARASERSGGRLAPAGGRSGAAPGARGSGF